ncbi:MAG: phosphoribosylglycinamide formyltransferase [Flavobacteriales bacterium]|nr:phosphoribosylglycinamide formyltransferase [Flavobacteriales bacterium]
MKRIAVFASGNGSNAENLINYFRENDLADVSLVLTDNPKAKVISRAEKLFVPHVVITPQELSNGSVLERLKKNKIDFVVLAGFLRMVPKNIVEAFKDRIINIHPALLPSYGGKGMYGINVHKAVVDAGENETGITIHYVNENYDDGDIIFQTTTDVYPDDTPEDVAEKVHALEKQYLPQITEELLEEL